MYVNLIMCRWTIFDIYQMVLIKHYFGMFDVVWRLFLVPKMSIFNSFFFPFSYFESFIFDNYNDEVANNFRFLSWNFEIDMEFKIECSHQIWFVYLRVSLINESWHKLYWINNIDYLSCIAFHILFYFFFCWLLIIMWCIYKISWSTLFCLSLIMCSMPLLATIIIYWTRMILFDEFVMILFHQSIRVVLNFFPFNICRMSRFID